ncbi:MAG: hypothetical protein JO347_06240 [Candidatus Eremiobacteraeota bacterium]|nr:hypothetical protein [Candidatus Eremiobacteraeota bacterium]
MMYTQNGVIFFRGPLVGQELPPGLVVGNVAGGGTTITWIYSKPFGSTRDFLQAVLAAYLAQPNPYIKPKISDKESDVDTILGNDLQIKLASKEFTQSPDYGLGPCATSDVLTMIGKDGVLDGDVKNSSALILARLHQCQYILNNYVASLPSTPPTIQARSPFANLVVSTPKPTVPPECIQTPSAHNDPARLYSMLAFCSGVVASIPSPTPSPPIPYKASRGYKIIYALGLAGDAPTSAQISWRLAYSLKNALENKYPEGSTPPPDPYIEGDHPVRYAVAAAPSWTLAQYQQQCSSDSSTAGAIAMLQPGTDNPNFNALAVFLSTTRVRAQAIVLDCEPTNTAYTNSASYVTWVSDFYENTGTRWSIPLATLLSAAAAYLIFHPNTSTMYTVAPPASVSPQQSYESGSTTMTNSGAGAIAAAGVAALTPFSSTNVLAAPAPDSQAARAIEKDVNSLMDDLAYSCSDDSNLIQCNWVVARPRPKHR